MRRSVRALVFGLTLVAIAQLLLPARAVALLPALRHEGIVRRAVPGLGVALSRVRAQDLRLLAAGAQQHGAGHGRAPEDQLCAPHDLLGSLAGCGCGTLAEAGLPYAVPQPQTSLPLPRLRTRVRKMSAITSPSPPSSALVEHISAQAGSLPSARRLRPYFSNSVCEPLASGPPAQKVHLSIFPRRPKVPLVGNCGAPKGQAYEQ